MQTLVEQYPLEYVKPFKKTLSSLFGYLFLLVFLGIGFGVMTAQEASVWASSSFNVAGVIYLALTLFVLMIIGKYVYEVFYMKYYFYNATKTELIIKKGVFSVNEITLPFNRIQDIYVDQDILDRIFGLYDVHVSSATAMSEFLSHIDGVNKTNADALKNFLLKKVGRKNGK